MADDSIAASLDTLHDKQQELIALVDEMQRDPDQERQQAAVRRIAVLSNELSRMSAELSERVSREVRDQRGSVIVALTPDQQGIVRARTGVDLDSVTIEGQNAVFVRTMPTISRDQITAYAIEQGHERRRFEEGRRAAQAELARISDELSREAPASVRQEIERLLDDPEFKRAFEDPRQTRKL